jgi:hypothetical protein
MKLHLRYTAWLCAASLTAALSACSSDDFDYDDYMPGPSVGADSPQLYFDASNESSFLFTGDDNRVISLQVDRIDSIDAITVPIIFSGDSTMVSAPKSVSFAAGERTTTIAIDCTGIPFKTATNFSLAFPTGYATPYGAGTDTYSAKVTMAGDWVILADDVIYQYLTSGGENKWEPTFYQKLWHLEGTERLKFENFLNSGYDLVFTVAADTGTGYRRIEPLRNYLYWRTFYPDDDQYGCWYFYDEASKTYPSWSPDGNDPVISYMLVYDTDSSNGYQYTYMPNLTAGTMACATFVTLNGFTDGTSTYIWNYVWFTPKYDPFATEE